ncbi:hypothetical protein B0H13DRAFT_2337192 [Mycena leptocephala]|nr:hypothetical protein B0H13DRAFT_2337192 [Mycena leptocephala]
MSSAATDPTAAATADNNGVAAPGASPSVDKGKSKDTKDEAMEEDDDDEEEDDDDDDDEDESEEEEEVASGRDRDALYAFFHPLTRLFQDESLEVIDPSAIQPRRTPGLTEDVAGEDDEDDEDVKMKDD